MTNNKSSEYNESTDLISSYGSVHASYNGYRGPEPVGNGSYMRSSFNIADYNNKRWAERIPQTVEESMHTCDRIYRDVHIVRSIIDMMSDFTVQGIRIQHRDPEVQRFLNEWSKYVDFYGVSERIANTLYRLGNCPVKSSFGKVPLKIERDWKKVIADISIEDSKVEYKNIPLKYVILNPTSLEAIGGDLAHFVGKPIYGIRPSEDIMSFFSTDKTHRKQESHIEEYASRLIKTLPDKLKTQVINGKRVIPIDPDRLHMLYYKKDDWNPWAWPIVHSILDSIFTLNKMRLADKKALDGAISQIRLWRLGNIEHKIHATPAGINKLRSILSNIGTGEAMDLIWGPELDFIESDSKSYNFLLPEKYQQVMTEIYAGLGVPPALTGSEKVGSTSNNAVSMRTLIERLEYVRKVIIRFWEGQLAVIQKAMRWKYPASVTFDFKVMGEEHVEKRIIIDLWDRNLISTERLMELCRQNPELEKIKIARDKRLVESGKLPPKASPYHSPNTENELRKIILQQGGVAPSEVGLKLKKKKEGEKSFREAIRQDQENTDIKVKDKAGKGRPLGVQDSEQRTRVDKPKNSMAFLDLFTWANKSQSEIDNLMKAFCLEHFKKPSIKSLTKEEVLQYEELKFKVLSCIEPFSDISANVIQSALAADKNNQNDIFFYREVLRKIYTDNHGASPKLTDLRQIQASAYASFFEDKV